MRRRFLKQISAAALTGGLAGILQSRHAPAATSSNNARPLQSWGLQVGDVLQDRAIIWSRADRPSRLMVEWSADESFARSTLVPGPYALEGSDFTARVDITGLPAGAELFVRTHFQDPDSGRIRSEPVTGRLRTAPAAARDLRLLWGGDVAGQGWGIDLSKGGMRTFEAMRRTQADFFIHSGDTIYADGPLEPTVKNAAGEVVWTNAFLDEVPEKRKVAETLREFHRAHLYNRHDAAVRAFSAEIPQLWQWDDHEVVNNWSDSKVLPGAYLERQVRALAANAARAFLDYSPIRPHSAQEPGRVYRRIAYGPDLDVFMLDMRSYRGPNTRNDQSVPGPDTAFLGQAQLAWLKRSLKASRATWKVIAADMPIGLVVADDRDSQGHARFEAIANGSGRVLGRELEIAELLRFIKREAIVNTVLLTADVHYCAAHHYDPERAVFRDFEPFWEFVSGPLHAGAFGPGELDGSFGPKVVFQKYPPAQNTSPAVAEYQFFGQLDIDGRSKEMVVSLKDANGTAVFSQRLPARASA